MDLVAGALGMLPSKLLELLKDEYKLQADVKEKIVSLSRELEDMHAALRKVAEVPRDQLDPQVRLWARDVREASYDVEDVLDIFLVRVDGGGPQPADANKVRRLLDMLREVRGLLNMLPDLLSFRKVKARHDIAGAIEDIRKKLQEIDERRKRYRVDELILAKPAATTSIDPRLSALYTKVSQLVGIDEPREKLIQMLSVGDDDVSDKETKIVCVVGFGGLGKTTLAKAVYEKLTVNIPCKAFVPVGRNPDLKKVLKDILLALDKQRYTTQFNYLTILDERQLIDELREFLKDKRYFIVIDDIWDVRSWNTIKYAFDDNSLSSKIIITTRNHDVAEKVSSSYEMKPLPEESSKILFYERIFESADKCPRHLLEVCEKILKKCGGVPLAIITTSSLLANKSKNMKEWLEVCDSIGLGLGSNDDMDTMRKILSLSYYDLPWHLKTCLLYLSVFPEDHNIYKRHLILRWIAEDFVQHEDGSQSLFEIGENYFTELINRSLIQPLDFDCEGKTEACRVHDMVLDLICSLSREENFVTSVFGDIKQNTPSGSKVRRLSLSNTTWPTTNMPKLRSLTTFGDTIINSMLSLSCYHLLRVLDLEGCNLKDLPSLRFVGNLLHLRYLGLRGTWYSGELPVEIGKLQFLQTLDLDGTSVKELPSSIVELRQLKYLLVDRWNTRLPDGLRNLTSLDTLFNARVDSACIAEELGYLTQLRELWVFLAEDTEGGWLCTALVESLGKLHKIQDLTIYSGHVVANLEGSVESLSSLRWLRIDRISSLPTWINPASLPLLSVLDIKIEGQVRTEDIQVLGTLKALRYLVVDARNGDGVQAMKRFTVSADAFPCVIKCNFRGFSTVPSMFPRGSMSELKEFEFCIQVDIFSYGEFSVDDLTMGHLPSLQQVTIRIYGAKKISEEVVTRVKEALRHEADVHPNHPSLIFRLAATSRDYFG